MNLPLTLMASILQTQNYEMDKQISPYELRLTSPISVEHLLLGTTIKVITKHLHQIFNFPLQSTNNMVSHPLCPRHNTLTTTFIADILISSINTPSAQHTNESNIDIQILSQT